MKQPQKIAKEQSISASTSQRAAVIKVEAARIKKNQLNTKLANIKNSGFKKQVNPVKIENKEQLEAALLQTSAELKKAEQEKEASKKPSLITKVSNYISDKVNFEKVKELKSKLGGGSEKYLQRDNQTEFDKRITFGILGKDKNKEQTKEKGKYASSKV